jgi:hypothetical protein
MIIHIRSTVDDAGKAACLLEWGPIQKLLMPAQVASTSRDLMAAAISAETDIALIQTMREELKLPDRELAAFLGAVRARRSLAPGEPVLRIAAVAGAKTGKPLVHVSRGSMRGELSPDEARTMAINWVEAATAAAIDVRLRYALGEWGRLTPGEVEKLFELLGKVHR